uniref:SH2 domain containing 4A n=1 Tax=Paramormyrops kingsleyae TaxID=1676925 RepID=A0A3B3QZ74_9TELE
MLQQILTDMYIDPELLAELNEEQKQTLFFKMRGEQIRRWKEREAQLEKQEVKAKKPSRRAGKQVSWLHSSNDDVWVWVMGEHPTDTPYEQICDAIMAERAARQAQDEAEQLRAQKEKELVKRFSKIYMDPEVELCRQEEEQKEHMRQEAAEEQRKIEEELKVFWGGLSQISHVISSFTFQPSIHLPTVYPSLGHGGVECTPGSIGHE